MQKRTPYTYLIGWPSLNRWYYGVRYAKNCHPSDLWITYFTSSAYVKEFVDQHGNPDIIKIHKVFADEKEARAFESKMLKRMSVTKKEKWLNKHDIIAVDPICVPRGDNHWTKQHTEQHIESMKLMSGDNHWTKQDTCEALLHKEMSAERGAERWSSGNNPSLLPKSLAKKSGDNHWIRQNTVESNKHIQYLKDNWSGDNNPSKNAENMAKRTGDGHWTKQKTEKTELALKLMSEKAKINNAGENNSQYGKKGKNHPAYGTKRKRVVCEHCNKDVATNVYAFAHGEKCKNKT